MAHTTRLVDHEMPRPSSEAEGVGRGISWSTQVSAAVVGALCCHLVLVVAGAAHLTHRVHGPVGRGLRFYDALSGAGDSYSFFAPEVGPQLRARFTLSTPQGERSEETLENGKSREVGFRLGNLAGTVYIVAK